MKRPTLHRAPVTVRVGVALGCVALISCGGRATSDPDRIVVRTERTWVDASRPTPPTSSYAGAPQRTLRVLIWQPQEQTPHPLLIMAHGFGGLPDKFEAFASTIAAEGFVVAAPAFPLTNENAPGGHEAGLHDVVNQPADLSFVLTVLLQAAHTGGDPLDRQIVDDKIAVLGHSLGGLTVIGMTRKDCCRDPRVGASILVAAPASASLTNIFGSDPISAGPPTLIIQGTADTTLSYSNASTLFDLIAGPRFLLGLNGAGHSDAVEDQLVPPIPARDAAQRATVAFLHAVFDGRDADLDHTLTALAAEGNIVQLDRGHPASRFVSQPG